MHESNPNRRKIGPFALALINVAAICSIKNWPLTAEYGFSSLFLILIALFIFFIPTALVAAELSSAWPEAGGIFFWVREAFGERWGFLAVWYLWVTNLPWYPTILAFIAGALAYTFSPSLANQKWFTWSVIVTFFWGATFFNLKGIRISSWISGTGAFLGAIIPGLVIIGCGFGWVFSGHPIEISFTRQAFIGDFGHLSQFVFFVGILFSLAGIEMSAVHAKEVKDPFHTYPRAILFSTILIALLTACGTLAIAIVIPQGSLSLVSASLDAFALFFNKYHLQRAIPFVAIAIALGAYGQMSTWIAGPSRGLAFGCKECQMAPLLQKLNSAQMPQSVLLIQAMIVTILSTLFLWMPTVSSSFWLLTTLTAQFYLLMYILFFATALRLRYTRKNRIRPYQVGSGFWKKILGENGALWIVALLGISASAFAFFLGFIPPAQLEIGSRFFYLLFLICGICVGSILPWCFLLKKT